MHKTDWHEKCFYRVSLKAIIRNESGEILFVKEKNNPVWNLPGGGMDYGETEQQTLSRELVEEVGYTGAFSYVPIGTLPMYLDAKQAWQLWVVYEVVPENYNFIVGDESTEVAFFNPGTVSDISGAAKKFLSENNLF